MREERFVADGRDRLLADAVVEAELGSAISEIEARYAPLLNEAGLLSRLRLRRQMRREIEREVELRAPRTAVYVRA